MCCKVNFRVSRPLKSFNKGAIDKHPMDNPLKDLDESKNDH